MGILKYKTKNKRYEIDNILKWYVNPEMTLEESVKCPLPYSMVINNNCLNLFFIKC